MSFYTSIYILGDYCDVDVKYDIIDGDDSVGLPVDYEFEVSYIDEDGNEVDITEQLTAEEYAEVIKAIEEDLERDDYDYVD
jgi:hypothetical protein